MVKYKNKSKIRKESDSTDLVSVEVCNIAKTYFKKTSSNSKLGLDWRTLLGSLFHSIGKVQAKTIEFNALNNVSFELLKGEALGIIGLNGSGKSTLLQIISGTLNSSNGSVIRNGSIAALLELGSGFNHEFSGKENVYLNGSIFGFSTREIHEIYEAIIKFADIGDFINQPVKTYSSGMIVRLAFAVIVHLSPDILIIDEALAVGDARFQAKCYSFLEDFRKSGRTLIFVSHDLNSVAQLCSRVILLHEGSIFAEGKPLDTINVYNKLITGNYQSTLKKASLLLDNAKESRWSYGGTLGEILSIQIFDENNNKTLSINSGQNFTVVFDIIAHVKIREPIYALKLRNTKGQVVYGQNTKFARLSVDALKLNDRYRISFNLTANLASGSYLLSIGFTNYKNGELQVIHRMHDAIELKVINLDGSFGISNCNCKIKVNKLDLITALTDDIILKLP